MMKANLLARSLILALIFAVGTIGWGCNGDDNGTDDVGDTDVDVGDVPVDDVRVDDVPVDDVRVDDVPVDDVPVDDVPVDDVPVDNDVIDVEVDLPCPANCWEVPEGGAIGAACVSAATCDHAANCMAESVEFFNGEMYVDDYQGACVLYGAGAEGCDPEIPATCPAGSECIYMGESMGIEYWGCWDACDPVDTSGNPYDYNCGCRVGYDCSITGGVCMGGCSHDRQCCERWWDLNDDYNRQAGEVVVRDGCTNTCDSGGLYDDDSPEPGLCEVSFRCINNGDPANVWSGPCEGDAWCPPDGRCLDGFHYTDDEGNPYFPGGACLKDVCNYVGRGCSTHGGACADLGTADDPFYACVGTCHFGREITADDYECRTTEGEEQVCSPVNADFWYTPPADGSDGFCWPPYVFEGTDPLPLGSACTEDEDCVSPFGLANCVDFSLTMTPFCALSCSNSAAEGMALCGGDIDPADPDNDMAAGACWSGICWESCPDSTAALGENGCSSIDNACYPAGTFTGVTIGTDLDMPDGICIPKCVDDAWCADMWGMPMTCNPTTGVCGA